jgi:DNA-binding NarL/FixJ family response regulator
MRPSLAWERRMQAGRVLIIEDHPLFRDALRGVAGTIVGETGVAAYASMEELLRTAPELPGLALIVVDVGLPGMSGAEAVATLCLRYPGVPVAVVSATDDRKEIDAVLKAGARCFISKAATSEMLTGLLSQVLEGKSGAAGYRPTPVMADTAGLPALTPRQLHILTLIGNGHSNKEIGLRLNIAEITVKQHVSALFRSLDVRSRTQAVSVARRLGLL